MPVCCRGCEEHRLSVVRALVGQPHSQTRSASDALLQAVDLAVAAEELGADGAYFRVHHFARQLASPFPLLAAIGAKTERIEIGTGVIDMRYENPMYMAEDAGAADLIAGGRLQLGISRGSRSRSSTGGGYFGYQPAEGETDADMARKHAEVLLKVLEGKGFAQPNPRPDVRQPARAAAGRAAFAGPAGADLVGCGLQRHRGLGGQARHEPESSTLKNDEGGEPFHVQQAEQIRAFRKAWAEAGHGSASRACRCRAASSRSSATGPRVLRP